MKNLKYITLAIALFGCFSAQAGEYHKNCEQPTKGYHTVPFDDHDRFVEECAPDTLYGWYSLKQVKIWAEKAQNNISFFELTRPLFTWRTPIGTFGYGGADGASLRIKLRDDVEFRFDGIQECRNDDFTKNVVLVVYDQFRRFADYILCSSIPIASWSYGLREHLNEMQKEKDWVFSHEKGDFDRYIKISGCSDEEFQSELNKLGVSMDDLVFDYLADPERTGVEAWTRSGLDQKIANIAKLVESNEGKVFFSTGANGTYLDHFKTKTDSYFH